MTKRTLSFGSATPERVTIRENSAAEILGHLKELTPSRFRESAEHLYLGRWTQEPGWQATVHGMPSKLSEGLWYCMFREVGSGTVVTANTVRDISTLRHGDSVTVSGRIRDVRQGSLESVSLEDAIVRGDKLGHGDTPAPPVHSLTSDRAGPALPAQPRTIRENSAEQILTNLKGCTPSEFHAKVKDLYLGYWTREPGWQVKVYILPSKLSEGRWSCAFREVGSDTLVMAAAVEDISDLRAGDVVTISGRISEVWQALPVCLEDATVRRDNFGKVHTMIRTVLELDLVGYSTIGATLEAGLDVQASPKLNKQIQDFVDVGLKAVGVSRAATVMQTTGDGAILVFDQPPQAHVFADAVQQDTRRHNAGKAPSIGKRVFRVGIATGELVMEPKATGGFDIAGMTIARAVRMEAKAKPGEVLCDTDTFAGLTAEQQKRYSGVETIAGKRDEKFDVRRCVLNPDGVKDAEFFTGPAPSAPPEATPPKPDPATQAPKLNRREILELFTQLKPLQYDPLIILVQVPINRRPPEVLDIEERKNKLLKWADEAGELENLLLELRYLVGVGDASRPK